MDISVVIPSYNTQASISATLASVEKQQTTIEFEIIVVDCSEHSKVEEIATRFALVKFRHESERFNPGKGRNIGAQQALGSLIIFIDADVQLEPHALNSAWAEYKSGKTIFGGALDLNKTVDDGYAAYLEHYFFNHESQKNRPPTERENLSSALMCVDKHLFISEGGFKDIPRMQDTELTERIRKKGHTLYFCPSVSALQTQNSPIKKVIRKIYINGQNIFYIRYQNTASLVKKVGFAVFLPLIAFTKSSRIIGRHIKHQPTSEIYSIIKLSPSIYLAGFIWMIGFYNALITERGISEQR